MIKYDLPIEFLWIPSDLGGHCIGPFSGMRLSIRWQEYIEFHLQCMRDAQCLVMDFNPASFRGKALCFLPSKADIPKEWLQDNKLIELVSGFRVLAVGKIINPLDDESRNL